MLCLTRYPLKLQKGWSGEWVVSSQLVWHCCHYSKRYYTERNNPHQWRINTKQGCSIKVRFLNWAGSVGTVLVSFSPRLACFILSHCMHSPCSCCGRTMGTTARLAALMIWWQPFADHNKGLDIIWICHREESRQKFPSSELALSHSHTASLPLSLCFSLTRSLTVIVWHLILLRPCYVIIESCRGVEFVVSDNLITCFASNTSPGRIVARFLCAR